MSSTAFASIYRSFSIVISLRLIEASRLGLKLNSGCVKSLEGKQNADCQDADK